jgi:hypothetical protein
MYSGFIESLKCKDELSKKVGADFKEVMKVIMNFNSGEIITIKDNTVSVKNKAILKTFIQGPIIWELDYLRAIFEEIRMKSLDKKYIINMLNSVKINKISFNEKNLNLLIREGFLVETDANQIELVKDHDKFTKLDRYFSYIEKNSKN